MQCTQLTVHFLRNPTADGRVFAASEKNYGGLIKGVGRMIHFIGIIYRSGG